MRSHQFPLVLIILSLLLVATSAGQVSGPVTADTTWTQASSPVSITGTVLVPGGVSLTIEAGTIVQFASGTGLVVEGKLVAAGTAADTIVFTSAVGTPARGDWNGIEFANTSDVGSVMDYVRIEYIGGGTNEAGIFYRTGAYGVTLSHMLMRESSHEGVNVRASSPVIEDSRFEGFDGFAVFSDLFSNFELRRSIITGATMGGVRVPLNAAPVIDSSTIENNGDGIYVDIGAAPTITNNLIQNNVNGIYYVNIGVTQPVLRDNTIQGNTSRGIRYDGSNTLIARYNYWGSDYGPYNNANNPTGRGDTVSNNIQVSPWMPSGLLSVTEITASVATNTTWGPGVYWIKNNISVNTGVTLTLEPGAIVKFNPGTRLTVVGAIQIQGTHDSLVVFTSVRDDSYGGDTNGDGEATQPAPSNWEYVWVQGSWSASHVIVKYSAYGFYTYRPVSVNGYYATSNGYGMYVYNNGTAYSVDIDNSAFGANTTIGLQVDGTDNTTISINRSTFNGNSSHGIYVSNGTITSFDSSEASYNGSDGVRGLQNNAATSSNFTASRFVENGRHGLVYGSRNASLVTVDGNSFMGNAADGLIISKATVTNNTFEGNRTGIVLQGDVGSTYSGNTFTSNTYNASVGLRSDLINFEGVLSTTTPAGLNSGVYLLLGNSAISSGKTLTIQPGVIVKVANGRYLTVNGALNAQGTDQAHIIFTSYRDHSVGGNINVTGDTTTARRGDWAYIRFLGTQQSLLDYVTVLYSQYGLYSTSAVWQNPITHFTSMHASSYGSYFDNGSTVTFEHAAFRYNANGLASYNMEIILRNATISDNTSRGFDGAGGVGPKEVSNSQIERNGTDGLVYSDATGPLTMVGNTIHQNGARGVWYRNTTAPRSDVQYIGNTVSNNGDVGIVSSRARFVDNAFNGNNYPLGVTGYLGYIYTDNTGVDGNTFSGNTNTAISVRNTIGDTLQFLFPLGLTSHTYVFRAAIGDYGTSPLIVEPGVVMKFDGNGRISRSKRLEAVGTATAPIVWTSWRDASYGGKTNAATDTLGPQKGNWQYVRLIGSQGAHDSKIEHVIAQYGHYPFYITNVPLVNPIRNVYVRQNESWGMYLEGSTATLDSVTVDSSRTGVGAYSNSTISVLNSVFRGNVEYGLYADNGSEFAQVTTTSFSGNRRGIWIAGANAPQVFQNNIFSANTDYGIYAVGDNASIDTLLLIDGNTFSGSSIGLRSSRAYIVDNVFQQNTYPLAVSGLLSLAGTGNEHGNYYAGNSFQQNQHNVIRIIGNVNGVLGGTTPDSLGSRVIAMFANVTIPTGAELHIRPGTIIKAYNSPYMTVSGQLFVEGTSDDKVVITSWRDDTYGGDSNADTTATIPAKGDMGYLRILNSNSSTVHAISSLNLRYSSYGVAIENASQVTVDSSWFANNSYAFYRSGTGSATVTNSEFRDNTYGFYNQAAGAVSISASNFSGNSTYALKQNYSSTIEATNNYWGAATGPLVTNGPDLNPGGTGDKIDVPHGTVNYRPFYTGRSGVLAGDVSENGDITAYDASLTLQHVVGSITLSGLQQSAADVTQDGSVSALDASLILRYVVGYISGFRTITQPEASKEVPPSYQVRSVAASDNQIDLIVSVAGDGIYATELDLSYPAEHWSVVSVTRTPLSESFLIAHNAQDGSAKVALAGADNPRSAGDWVVVRFTPLTESADPTEIQIDRFEFNETSTVTTAEEMQEVVPTEFALAQNYPNPFNPSTTIGYDVPMQSTVSLRIYDMLGRHVMTLFDGERPAGVFRARWNGLDDSGRRVTSGIYFMMMHATSQDGQTFRTVRKMVLTK